MQRYAFKDGKSCKFWQIEQQGCELHISWGKQGTAGQRQVKSFDSEAQATAAQDKLVKEKTGKGYVATGDAMPQAPTQPGPASQAAAATPVTPTQAVAKKPGGKRVKANPPSASEPRAQAPANEGSVQAPSPHTAAPSSEPAGGADTPSLQAPRTALEAWLTAQRNRPSVQERAQALWLSGLQQAQAQQATVSLDELRQQATGDADALREIHAALAQWGGQPCDVAGGLAAQQTHAAQAAADLARLREAMWQPLAASEPAHALASRLGPLSLMRGGLTWGMVDDVTVSELIRSLESLREM